MPVFAVLSLICAFYKPGPDISVTVMEIWYNLNEINVII